MRVTEENTFVIGTIPLRDTRAFFQAFVEVIQPFIKVRDREAQVFSEFLYQAHLRRHINPIEDRFKLVFGNSTRKEVQRTLGISDAVLRNALSYLRKKRLIVDNKIPDIYLVEPAAGKEISIAFEFLIQDS